MKLLRAATIVLACAGSLTARAQGVPLQGGPGTAGHAPMYYGGGLPVLVDSGPAGGAGVGAGAGLSELNVTARGTGTAPYAGQGTGPDGTLACVYDGNPATAAAYHYLCLSANALGGGLIDYGAGGSASLLPLQFKVNGSLFTLPSSSGTVTSVALADDSTTPIFAVSGSPVTISGTLGFTLKTQTANAVLAGPTSGSAAQPAFRALVNADIPSALNGISIGATTPGAGAFTTLAANGAVSLTGLGTGTAAYAPCLTSAGLLIEASGGNCFGGGGGGSVTSVALADGSTIPIFAISGSPVTGSGTLTFTLDTQSANKVFAGPTTGSAAQPGFRSLVSGDIPILNQSTTGNAATATALAATPSQCSGDEFATGVTANGTANCATPSGSGDVSGPGSSTSGYVPVWSGTTGTELGVGLAASTTVNSESCELGGTCTVAAAASTLTGSALASGVTSAPGLLSASGGTFGSGAFAAAYSLPDATTSVLGGVKCDGTTTTCSSGVISAVGGSATSIAIGTTTISGGASNGLLYNDDAAVGNLATGANGVVVTSGSSVPSVSTTLPSGLTIPSPTLTTPALGTPASGVATHLTGLPLSTGVTGTLPLADGGTAADLTASAGGIVYSTASAFAVLAGTTTADECLLSGDDAAPSWGTCGSASFDFPITVSGTTTSGGIPYFSSTTKLTSSPVLGNDSLIAGGGAGAAPFSDPDTFIDGGELELGASGVGGSLVLNGATSGTTTLVPTAAAGTTTATLPAATDTIVELAQTQTLTNKSIAGSEINSGTIGASYLPTTFVANGADVLALTNPSSAVDYLTMTGSVSGDVNDPALSVAGSDTSIPLSLKDKGGAGLNFDSAGNTSFYVGSNDASAMTGVAVIGSDSGAPPFIQPYANDTETNVGLNIYPTGTGQIDIQNLNGSIYPMAPPYSCAGNGTTDDTTCLTAAATAACNGTLYLGDHLYKISTELSLTCPERIIGTTEGWGTSKSSGIVAGAANMSLLSLGSPGDILEYVYLDMNYSGVDTSGAAVTIPDVNSVKLQHVYIDSACIGVDLSGNTDAIDDVYIGNDGGGTACDGLRIGYLTNQGNTIDARITNVTIQGNMSSPPATDQLILDAGGLYEVNNDMLYGTIGTYIDPGTEGSEGQQVNTPFFANTVLGDTTVDQALVINASASTAWAMGGVFSSSWAASSSADDNVLIENTGSGKVSTWTFNGFRSYNAKAGAGFNLSGGDHIYIVGGSQVCGYDTDGVKFAEGMSYVTISDDVISPSCGVQTSSGTVGISYSTGNTNINAIGNDLYGNSTPQSGNVFGSAIVIPARVATSDADSISAVTDNFVCPLNTSAAATETLPSSPASGQTFTIKDCHGSAATHSITVEPASGDIDGASTFVMSTSYESAAFTYVNSQWSVN